MSSESPLSTDLLDLKLLPAWVKETETRSYEHYTGEEEERRPRNRRQAGGNRSTPSVRRPTSKAGGADRPQGERDRRPRRPGDRDHRPRRAADGNKQDRHLQDRPREQRPPALPQVPPPDITIRFLPRTPVFDNVIEQIKSGPVAYSLFHLARLFLEKPERYEVRFTAKPESPLFQLGEDGAVSLNRQFLEQGAFGLAQENFYKVDITAGEPIKGNFTSVARDPLSRTLLGPTNYHSYQPRLRTLYEQRFSRRMSFAEYQRQIEIVSDPALVERWKEDAQRVTTYTTLREETPSTFSSVAEVERHFQSNYLPTLVRSVEEAAIGGVQSRHLPDRVLHRAVEDAWAHEIRSPSQMMQELAGRLRDTGLHIFRHRRGMLFVSSLWPRPFKHEEAGVSPQVKAILDLIAATPGLGRKELADKLIVDVATATGLSGEEAESRKLSLASDLHWLISAGYVIEFNDGSLDLPREKAKPVEAKEEKDTVGAETVSEPNKPPEEVPNPKSQAPEKSQDPFGEEGAQEEPGQDRQKESAPVGVESEIGGS